MCAMLEINANCRLKELGWRLLLQVKHNLCIDEIKKDFLVKEMTVGRKDFLA